VLCPAGTLVLDVDDTLYKKSGLNVDLDVMLAVLAQALLAALHARLPGYHAATPDTIQRRFLENLRPDHHRRRRDQDPAATMA
jgi:hypothetical protein